MTHSRLGGMPIVMSQVVTIDCAMGHGAWTRTAAEDSASSSLRLSLERRTVCPSWSSCSFFCPSLRLPSIPDCHVRSSSAQMTNTSERAWCRRSDEMCSMQQAVRGVPRGPGDSGLASAHYWLFLAGGHGDGPALGARPTPLPSSAPEARTRRRCRAAGGAANGLPTPHQEPRRRLCALHGIP